MLEAEAARIRELVLARGISPLLNIGSSTAAYRSVEGSEQVAVERLRVGGQPEALCDEQP